VAILCPDEDIPDEIASWAVWRSPTEIFWISTKPRYEGLGFACALLKHIVAAPGPIYTPIVPNRLATRAREHGYRLLARPYMTLESS